jgi:uncharacterized protein
VFIVDSNVLLDAANRKSDFQEPCRRALEQWRARSSVWYLSWPICYEFLRVCTHPRVFPSPWSLERAWGFLQDLFDGPGVGVLQPTGRHAEVLSEVIAEFPHLRGNILHDAHTAVLMREHGIKQIYTRDSDFHRFPFLTVIDPTR